MKSLFLFIILITTPYLNAQNFIEEHYRFDTFYKTTTGNYNRGIYYKAVETIDSLKDNKFVKKDELFFFARAYSLNNQFDKTLFYLEKAVKKGITKQQVENMYDLDKFRENHLYLIFNVNYDKWHNVSLEEELKIKIDSVYYKQIVELQKASLTTRKFKVTVIDGDEVYEEFETKDSLDQWKAEIKQDSINFFKLAQLIIDKGFPTQEKVGDASNTAMFMLKYKNQKIDELFQVNCIWEPIVQQIKKEMVLGNLPPYYLAYLTDISKTALAQPQIYFTIFKTSYCAKIANCIDKPEELNIRRKSVGLCSIELEFWANAQEFPKELYDVLNQKK